MSENVRSYHPLPCLHVLILRLRYCRRDVAKFVDSDATLGDSGVSYALAKCNYTAGTPTTPGVHQATTATIIKKMCDRHDRKLGAMRRPRRLRAISISLVAHNTMPSIHESINFDHVLFNRRAVCKVGCSRKVTANPEELRHLS